MSAQREQNYVYTWDSIKKLLDDPKYSGAIERAAAHTKRPVVSPEDAKRSIVGCVIDNPYLGGCHELSFAYAAIQSIRTGLPIGKPLDLAYLVPRWNEKLKRLWAYFTPSYMGLMTVARRSGDVTAIYGKVVREGDIFSYREGTSPAIDHEPHTEQRGQITHAYAVAHLTGSPVPVFVVLDRDEINKRRAIADALKRKPEHKNAWDRWETEMTIKSAVVALSHFLPRSPEFGFALFAEQQLGAGELDEGLVGELGAMIDAKLLPATGAQSIDVEGRVGARAAELLPAAEPTLNASASAALHAEVLGGAPERATVTEDEARELASFALSVHTKSADYETWIAEVFARRGVTSLADLPPWEAREERARLQAALDAEIKT